MNRPFDRVILHPREKPLSQDINRDSSQLDYALRFLAESLTNKRHTSFMPTSDANTPANGFLGNDFRVVPSAPADLFVTLKRGLGFYYDATDTPSGIDSVLGLDDLSPYKPVVLLNDVSFAVPTPPGVNSRIDIIEVRWRRETTDASPRQVLDPATGAFSPNMLAKTLSFALDGSVGFVSDPSPSTAAISYKQGVVAASPVEPSTTPGYVKVARINVGTSVTQITASDIVDRRAIVAPGGVTRASGLFRVQWNGGAPLVTALSITAPPGVTPCATRGFLGGSAIRGSLTAFVVGGNFVGAVPRFNVMTSNSYIGALAAHPRCRRDFIPIVGFVNSTDQANLAACAPAVNVGIGTSRGAINLELLEYPAAGGAPLEDTVNMEDVTWSVEWDLYH